MAGLGLIDAKINALPAELRAPFLDIFRAFLRDLRFGHPKQEQPDPSTNFGAGFFTATTPVTPGTEFTIAHGFGRTPYLLVPVLPLDTAGAQLVPLTVSRVADDKRIYLKSTTASAPIVVLVEG